MDDDEIAVIVAKLDADGDGDIDYRLVEMSLYVNCSNIMISYLQRNTFINGNQNQCSSHMGQCCFSC